MFLLVLAVRDAAGVGMFLFFFQAEDGIRDLVRSRGLGDVYKRQLKEWDESAHGALWRDGKDGPVCSTCHEAHAIQDLSLIHI